VILEAREPIVRDLMRSWLTLDWTDGAPGRLMAVDVAAERVWVPDGYSLGTEARDGVVFVTVSAADGMVAAEGQAGILGGTADGRALYETLGWKAYAPLSGFV